MDFDNIVISPGPGSPACEVDIGICLQVLQGCTDIPILGVCLGHQALGFAHGARVVHAPEPVHGRLSEIEHDGSSMFHHIPSGRNSGFKVVRYHSLVIHPESLPKELIPTAWTTSLDTQSFLHNEQSDYIQSVAWQSSASTHLLNNCNNGTLSNCTNGRKPGCQKVLMGIVHCSRPHFGVQFHPESVASSFGRQIFENFKKITVQYGRKSSLRERKMIDGVSHVSRYDWPQKKSMKRHQSNACGLYLTRHSMEDNFLHLEWKKIDNLLARVGGSHNIFCELFGGSDTEGTFWLDSSSIDQNRARFSFMGAKGGPLWKQMTFHLSKDNESEAKLGGYLKVMDASGSVTRRFLPDGFLEFLKEEINSYRYEKGDYRGLPFEFYGGFVGYLGYELKVECDDAVSNRYESSTPDACFFFSDNLVVIDHKNGDVYILSIHKKHAKESEHSKYTMKNSWLAETEKKLLNLSYRCPRATIMKKTSSKSISDRLKSFVVDKSRDKYISDVTKCLQLIRDGESYELCLTTQMRRKVPNIDALQLYLQLRERNPAPYAAWLNFPTENLRICCSSPERFLRLDRNGHLEAKPIKGTIKRGTTSEEDERLRLQLQFSGKDQAENLMIVDLLRNDLGKVCEPGSVHVPRLMEVESYAAVHTMVSTIRGTKEPSLSPIDCIKAAFPGGSMTGAPKPRSMELLDQLEDSSRGIYSGSIGFFSYNGTFDLNIVIRTVVLHNGEASVGAGGAIVISSNPEDEYEEMLLKAKAPTTIVDEWAAVEAATRSSSFETTNF